MSLDKSGVPATCPLIDEIITMIDFENYNKDELIERMEELREANIKLREFGNEQYKKNHDRNN